MTEDIFRSKEEEAKQVAAEIRELKDIVREVSGKLSRIESRMKRAFPEAFAAIPRQAKPIGCPTPTLSPQQVLQLYDQFVESARGGDRENVQRRLTEVDLADLGQMAHELGVSLGKKKPSRKSLTAAILARINESVMLSRHMNREPSSGKSGGQDPDKGGSQ
jgi:hypothetical protein